MERNSFTFAGLFNPWLNFYADWLHAVSGRENAMRRFIRHPSDIPIAVTLDQGAEQADRLRDISEGGVSFISEMPLKVGSRVHIEISLQNRPHGADGTVAWCHREGRVFAVGVAFSDSSTKFTMRMVEQICHIEHYRAEVEESEGRVLSSEEAAREWVAKYAADFPA